MNRKLLPAILAPGAFRPSIADVIFLTLFFYICLFVGQGLLIDADTGHHIRAGEHILQTHEVPREDIFSFITPPMRWTDHGWLSQVIMALIHKESSLTGIVIFFAALISAVYSLLFRFLRAQTDHVILAAAVTGLVVGVSQLHWLARPHIFSHLMVVAWYYLLDSYQRDVRRSLWILPALMILWVNLHGGFIVGFIFLAIYLAENLVPAFAAKDEARAQARLKAKQIFWISVASLAAATANPSGWRILLFPFSVVSNQFMMDHIREYISPNFHSIEIFAFKFLLLILLALFASSGKKSRVVDILLVVFFANMALYSARHIPLFAFVAAPILVRHAEFMMSAHAAGPAGDLRRKIAELAASDRATLGTIWPAIGILTVVLFAAEGKLHYAFDPNLKPVAAVEFLKREPIPGNMFNDDEFGDYIIYAAWPQYKVFFDGRSDMYGAEMLKEYYKIKGFERDWGDVANKYKIGWIIDDSNSLLSRYLLKDQAWRRIYADTVASIYVKNSEDYRHLTDKYSDAGHGWPSVERDMDVHRSTVKPVD